jgi:hypothetical protein
MQLIYRGVLQGMSVTPEGGGDRSRCVSVGSVNRTWKGNDPFHEHITVVREGT